MKRTTVIAVAVVAIVVIMVAAAALLLYKPSNNPGGGGPVQTSSVSIKNLAFDPSSIGVTAGTTVTWTNNDTVAHTVTSDTGSAESFDSGTLQPGETYTHTFSTAGTFSYHCTIHPSMHGQVTVT